MPILGLYSWNQFTIPAGIPAGDLTGNSHPNDPNPANPTYDPGNPVTWIGQTFTFNGGAPTQIDIDDDDAYFEDGYVETAGAQTLAQDVVIDGTLYPAGSSVQNEFSLIDSSGQEIYVVSINGVNVGFTYAQGEEPTTSDTFTADSGLDGSPADNADGTSSSTEPYADVICFAAGTQIATPTGPRKVETLVPGQLITTADAGAQPLRWIGRTEVALTQAPDNIRPVLIPAGSLGGGTPRRDLVVSPQHRILLNLEGQTKTDPAEQVFAPAKGLLPMRGIRIMRGRKSVLYVHLLMPRHAVIYAEGAASESFYPGPSALRMMTPEQRRQIQHLYPALRTDPEEGYGPLARACLSVRQARSWARTNRDAPETCNATTAEHSWAA